MPSSTSSAVSRKARVARPNEPARAYDPKLQRVVTARVNRFTKMRREKRDKISTLPPRISDLETIPGAAESVKNEQQQQQNDEDEDMESMREPTDDMDGIGELVVGPSEWRAAAVSASGTLPTSEQLTNRRQRVKKLLEGEKAPLLEACIPIFVEYESVLHRDPAYKELLVPVTGNLPRAALAHLAAITGTSVPSSNSSSSSSASSSSSSSAPPLVVGKSEMEIALGDVEQMVGAHLNSDVYETLEPATLSDNESDGSDAEYTEKKAPQPQHYPPSGNRPPAHPSAYGRPPQLPPQRRRKQSRFRQRPRAEVVTRSMQLGDFPRYNDDPSTTAGTGARDARTVRDAAVPQESESQTSTTTTAPPAAQHAADNHFQDDDFENDEYLLSLLQRASYFDERIANQANELPPLDNMSFIADSARRINEHYLFEANLELGQRPCRLASAKRCRSQIDLAYKHPNVPAFALREYLRPDEEAVFLSQGILPEKPNFCELCRRYMVELAVCDADRGGHNARRILNDVYHKTDIPGEYTKTACHHPQEGSTDGVLGTFRRYKVDDYEAASKEEATAQGTTHELRGYQEVSKVFF